MQTQLRNMDTSIAKATGAERTRLVAEKDRYLDRAAKMDRQGVTPPPSMYMVGDPMVMQRLGYLNREIEFHAGQVNAAVMRGESALPNLLELHSLQHEYLELMRNGLNLGPQRALTGDSGLLAAMETLEQMHLQHYEDATRLMPDAVRLSEIRRQAYDAQFGHLPLEKRAAFLSPAQWEQRVALGNVPPGWTYDNRRYPTSKAFDKAWAMFFEARTQMERAIALHWDLMQHGIPDEYAWHPGAAPAGPGPIAASGAAPMRLEESAQFGAARPGETPELPRQPDAQTAEALTPMPMEGGQPRTFSDAFAPLAPRDWRVQAEMDRLGTVKGGGVGQTTPAAILNDKSLTQAQWRQVQTGAGERVWQQELDRLRQASARATDPVMREGFANLADEMQGMGWQGWIERQESRLAQSRAIGEKIAAQRDPNWPTQDEIALAFNDPNATWVRENGKDVKRPNETVARREILAERRAEIDAAIEGKTGTERARLVQEINYQNAAHGYDIPMEAEYQTMRELRDELAQMGRPIDNLFEQQVRERTGAAQDRVRGGMPEDRQRLADAAADLRQRAADHQAKREDWAKQRDDLIREMGGLPPDVTAPAPERARQSAMSDAERKTRIDALNKQMDRVYGSKEFKAGPRSPEVEAKYAELKKERDALMRRPSGAPDVPAGPSRRADLLGNMKRLEAILATTPEKLVVTPAELEKLRELAAMGHLPMRGASEGALVYAERVGKLLVDPAVKPEWELTATERQARYRNGEMPTAAVAPAAPAPVSGIVPVNRQGHYERVPGIAPPRYEDVPGTGRYPAPQPEGWATQLPDRFLPRVEAPPDGTFARQWIQEHLPQLYANTLRSVAYNATDFTNRVFINYGLNVKYMDSIGKFLFTFPTYNTRTPLQFAERIAHRPGQLLAYQKASQDVLQDNQRHHPDARESQRMKVNIGGKLVDYRDILPFAKLLDPLLYPVNVPEDPFTRTDPMSKFVQSATSNALGRPQPFVEALAKKNGVLPRDFTPSITQDNLQQISTRLTGHDFTPQGAAQRASSALVGGIPVNVDAYESYIRDQLASMELQQGKAIGHNQFVAAAETKSGPLWEQAKRQADAWLQQNRDYRGGLPVRSGVPLPDEEEIGKARGVRNAALDRVAAVQANPASSGPNDLAIAKKDVNQAYRDNPILDTLRPGNGFPSIEESVTHPGEYVPAPGSASAGYDWQREQDFARRQENAGGDRSLGNLYNERTNIQERYGVGSPQDIELTKQIIDRLRDPSANYPGETYRGRPMSEQMTAARSFAAEQDPKRAALTEQQYGLGPYFDPKAAVAAQTVLRFEDANKDVRAALKAAGYNDAIAAGAYDYARQIAEKVPGGHEYLIDLGALKRGLGVDQLQLAQDDYVQHHPELGQEPRAPSFDQQFRSGATGTADQPTRDLLTEHQNRVQELFAEHPEYRGVLDGLSRLPEHETEEHYIGQHREAFDALNAITNEMDKRGLGLANFRLEQAKAGQGMVNPQTAQYQRDQFQYEDADDPTRQALSDRKNLRNDLFAAHPEWRDVYHDYNLIDDPAAKHDFQRAHSDLFNELDAIDARITKDDAESPRLVSFREAEALAAKGYADPKSAGFLARENAYFNQFSESERRAYDEYSAFEMGDVGTRYRDLVTTLMDTYGGPNTPAGRDWWNANKNEYNAAKQAYNDGLRAIAVKTGADPLTAANLLKAAEGAPLLSHNSVLELADPKAGGGKGVVGGKPHQTLEQAMAAGLARYQERVQWQKDALANFGEVTQRAVMDPLDKLADFNKHTPELDWMRFYESLTSWEKATLKERGVVPPKGSPTAAYSVALAQATRVMQEHQRNRLDKGQKGNQAGIPGGFYGPGYGNKSGKQFDKSGGYGIKPAQGRNGLHHR
jgi:hypothetical protein